jgi:serine palmitoyltransferase
MQIELKNQHKYCLILDESFLFGTVGRTGRGLTELYNVPVRLASF